jgi:hypothetical protein
LLTLGSLHLDVANKIGQCNEWDPKELRSPVQPDTPKPIRLVNLQFVAVVILLTKAGDRVDGFVDIDIIVFVNDLKNCRRQPHVVPLATHITSRPHVGEAHEPIPYRPILSLPKLIVEVSQIWLAFIFLYQ